VDGWVSLEVSPLLAADPQATVVAAARLHALARLPNLLIKIPGTEAGLVAIEQTIFAGIPVNITLLFSREHYLAAAGAYMRGIERRLEAGLDAKVASVASLFVSRWDGAVRERVQGEFRNRLGIAVAMRTYKAYCDLLSSPRWLGLAAAGAQVQRLLWASTGVKDAQVPETLYADALVAGGTINTMPEKTLLAYAGREHSGGVLPADAGFAEAVLGEFAREGVDIDLLGARLQREGTAAFAASWQDLIQRIGAV
jgi:transaldolase